MLRPAERLKIELLTHGMAVSPPAAEALSGFERRKPLTLADYASTTGIALELEGGIWVNAPIHDFNPNFVDRPPHSLEYEDGAYFVRSGGRELPAHPVPVPDYHDETHPATGRLYTDYAITHTDRVRISPIQGCKFVCTFCDLPYDKRYEKMPIEGLVDSIARALEDPALPAHHVLISGGVPKEEDWPWLQEVYRAVPAAFPDVPVDVMMVPVPGRLVARDLYEAGIHGVSVNLEMFDTERSRRIMPQKARLGPSAWFDFIDEAVGYFGPGNVRSVIMVGLEPLETTLAGIRALAERGCEPVLSPFRPDPATPLRKLAPPTVEDLEELYQRAAEIVEAAGVKLGPRCIPCMHNTLTFPDGSDAYYETKDHLPLRVTV
jgi:hypothetical protein